MVTKTTKSLSLDSILVPAETTDIPDDKTILETRALDGEERKAGIKKLELDLALRKEYSNKLYCLIRNWLIAIFVLLLIQGSLGTHGYFTLSDKVLITIIGGTTLNVLGLFAIVANYIFPKSSTNSKATKKNT